MNSNNSVTILGVSVYDRTKEAGEVQQVLTKFGCSIRTRIGMHEVTDDFCSKSGLIILELFGDTDEQKKLEETLIKIKGVEIQKMVFAN